MKNKGTTTVNAMAAPARRHRCEECQDIFECHLCTIQECHELHWDSKPIKRQLFVCENCIRAQGLFTIVVKHSQGRGQGRGQGLITLRTYDHLTGAIVRETKHKIFPRPGGPRKEWMERRAAEKRGE